MRSTPREPSRALLAVLSVVTALWFGVDRAEPVAGCRPRGAAHNVGLQRRRAHPAGTCERAGHQMTPSPGSRAPPLEDRSVRKEPIPPIRAADILTPILSGVFCVGCDRCFTPCWAACRCTCRCWWPASAGRSPYGVVVLVGLMSRAPVRERVVGADRLCRWHSTGGRAVVLLMLLHAWGAVQSWADAARRRVSHRPGTPSTCWCTSRWPCRSCTISPARTWPGTASCRSAGRCSTHRCSRWCCSTAPWRRCALRASTGCACRPSYLKPPASYLSSSTGKERDAPHAESGQFFRWRFLTADHWTTAHPFSLSAPPTDTQLRLTVKTLGNGSAKLQHLEPGTWAVAEGHYGAMNAARRTQRDVLRIAGGVGITPMRALFETLPVGLGQDLLLLYRARSEQDLIFKWELDQIAEQCGASV